MTPWDEIRKFLNFFTIIEKLITSITTSGFFGVDVSPSEVLAAESVLVRGDIQKFGKVIYELAHLHDANQQRYLTTELYTLYKNDDICLAEYNPPVSFVGVGGVPMDTYKTSSNSALDSVSPDLLVVMAKASVIPKTRDHMQPPFIKGGHLQQHFWVCDFFGAWVDNKPITPSEARARVADRGPFRYGPVFSVKHLGLCATAIATGILLAYIVYRVFDWYETQQDEKEAKAQEVYDEFLDKLERPREVLGELSILTASVLGAIALLVAVNKLRKSAVDAVLEKHFAGQYTYIDGTYELIPTTTVSLTDGKVETFLFKDNNITQVSDEDGNVIGYMARAKESFKNLFTRGKKTKEEIPVLTGSEETMDVSSAEVGGSVDGNKKIAEATPAVLVPVTLPAAPKAVEVDILPSEEVEKPRRIAVSRQEYDKIRKLGNQTIRRVAETKGKRFSMLLKPVRAAQRHKFQESGRKGMADIGGEFIYAPSSAWENEREEETEMSKDVEFEEGLSYLDEDVTYEMCEARAQLCFDRAEEIRKQLEEQEKELSEELKQQLEDQKEYYSEWAEWYKEHLTGTAKQRGTVRLVYGAIRRNEAGDFKGFKRDTTIQPLTGKVTHELVGKKVSFRRGNKTLFGSVIATQNHSRKKNVIGFLVRVGEKQHFAEHVTLLEHERAPEVYVDDHGTLPIELQKKVVSLWDETSPTPCCLGWFYNRSLQTAAHALPHLGLKKAKVGDVFYFRTGLYGSKTQDETVLRRGTIVWMSEKIDEDCVTIEIVADKERKCYAWSGRSSNVQPDWKDDEKYQIGVWNYDGKTQIYGASTAWSTGLVHFGSSDRGTSGTPVWNLKTQQVLGTHLGGDLTAQKNDYSPFSKIRGSVDSALTAFRSKN